ncbi:MAG: hypothetical protein EBU81_13450, partial [Proteobacteria bacterium]|nr:hypothetical protein [Pseudomonadota bacterium]
MNPDPIRRRPFLRMTGLACLATAAGGTALAEDTAPDLHIEGYAGQVSYAQGAELTLHVSSSQRRFSVEITRMGAQREVVWKG